LALIHKIWLHIKCCWKC